MLHCNLWRIPIETNWNRCEQQRNHFNCMLICHCTFVRMQYISIISFFSGGRFFNEIAGEIERTRGERMENWKIIITLHYVFYLNFDSVDRRMPRAREFFRILKRSRMEVLYSLNKYGMWIVVHVWNASMHAFVKMYVKIIFYRSVWCDVMWCIAMLMPVCRSKRYETKRSKTRKLQ